MKNILKIATGITLSTLIFNTGFGQFVLPLGNFRDEYIGGDPTREAYDELDVVGVDNVFNLTGASLSYDLAGDSLSISIQGNYFDDILNDSNSLLGTTMGDLFISTDGLSWDIGDSTVGDFYGSGIETDWEYAVKLGTYSQPGLSSGAPMAGDLIQITDPGSQIIQSSANGIYRAKQEYRVSGDWAHNFADPTWSIEDGSLNVTINDFTDIFGSGLETMGFHWTMSCANDVLEFEVGLGGELPPVPEPASIGLMGLVGMGGFLFLRRRFQRRK